MRITYAHRRSAFYPFDDHGGPGNELPPPDVRAAWLAAVRARGHTRLLEGIQDFVTDEGHGMLDVWMSHGDQVSRVSDDWTPLARTGTCPITAVKHRRLPVFGLQFHPESTREWIIGNAGSVRKGVGEAYVQTPAETAAMLEKSLSPMTEAFFAMLDDFVESWA